LLIFQTNATSGFYYYNGTAWQAISGSSGGGSGYWDLSGTNINNNNAGNVGIGTNTPGAKLNVIGTAAFGTGSTAGGAESFAAVGATADGANSVALGGTTTPLAANSLAMSGGYANAPASTAIGQGSVTGGAGYSTALNGATVTGENAVAIGKGSVSQPAMATADYSLAMAGGEASALGTVAIGAAPWATSRASGQYSTSLGGGNASGDYSMAFGYNSTSSAESAISVIGVADAMYSVSILGTTTPLAANSLAMSGGYANAPASTAIGQGSVTGGAGYSTALNGATVTGENAVAIGKGSVSQPAMATADYSLAMAGGEASALGTVAIGAAPWATSRASGQYSTSLGGGNASGDYSMAFGYNSTSSAESAISVIGVADAMYSVSILGTTTPLAANSLAMSGGYANAPASTAIGQGSVTGGAGYSTALNGATVTGENAVAIGKGSVSQPAMATADYSLAMAGGEASALGTVAIGAAPWATSRASGQYSTSLGGGNASGDYSMAFGYNSTSSAESAISMIGVADAMYSVSILGTTTPLAANSVAISGGYANAPYSTAIGNGSSTTGAGVNVAIGSGVTAGGEASSAFGANVGTGTHIGAFAIGDRSSNPVTTMFAYNENDADNQMMMRFAGGYKLYSNPEATVGTQLAPGSNAWSTISDRRKKENFAVVDGEAFLKRIAKMELTSWNYKGQDPKQHRHYGPMAQDFYAAFGNDGVGTVGNDTTINQADMEGVSFVAIQALERRTTELMKRVAELEGENKGLKAENKGLHTANNSLKAELTERIQLIEEELRRGKAAMK
jgi:hypothetical protein